MGTQKTENSGRRPEKLSLKSVNTAKPKERLKKSLSDTKRKIEFLNPQDENKDNSMLVLKATNAPKARYIYHVSCKADAWRCLTKKEN